MPKKSWSLEEDLSMCFAVGFSEKHNREIANWINEVFGNERTEQAMKGRLSNLRGNNSGNSNREKINERIKEIESFGFKIPPKNNDTKSVVSREKYEELKRKFNELKNMMAEIE